MEENLIIRPATIDDVETIFSFIQSLAEFEKLTAQMTGNVDRLREDLFGNKPSAVEAIIAQLGEKSVGYGLFFYTYSTFLTKTGLYLEDLYVDPDYRHQGIGTALLKYVINLAKSRNYGRVECSVLDWNQPAINLYKKMGADILPDWRTCRIVL